MAHFINPLYVNNSLDGNLLNSVAANDDESVNRIVELMEAGRLTLLLPHSVKEEAEHPNAPSSVRSAAYRFLCTEKVPLTQPEQDAIRRLLEEARGDAQAKNIDGDLRHVAEAAKYGGYFITRDRRLLKRHDRILALMKVEVVTPEEFLKKVAQAVAMEEGR